MGGKDAGVLLHVSAFSGGARMGAKRWSRELLDAAYLADMLVAEIFDFVGARDACNLGLCGH